MMTELKINIQNIQQATPPSQSDIEQQTTRLNSNIDQLYKKVRPISVCAIVSGVATIMFVLAILAVTITSETPNELFKLLSLYALLALVTTGFFAIIALYLEDKTQKLQHKVDDLSYVEARHCIDIEKWLVNSDVSAYRDAVVGLGRRFINAEIELMRQLFADTSEKDEAKQACQRVYLQGLTH